MTKWIVVAETDAGEKRRECDSRSEAEDVKSEMSGLVENVRIETVDGTEAPTSGPGTPCNDCGGEIPADAPEGAELCEHHGSWALATSDGGQTQTQTQTVADRLPPEERDSSETQSSANAVVESEVAEKLPEKPAVDEDPLTWMPAEFTDQIDGTVAINRKGYEVMAHHYGISTQSECLVGPETTDFAFCRVKATATKPDGTEYQAHGSAHVDRGDDPWLLLEMADTRARKRAVAQATGVGMAAVEELQNKP